MCAKTLCMDRSPGVVLKKKCQEDKTTRSVVISSSGNHGRLKIDAWLQQGSIVSSFASLLATASWLHSTLIYLH
eukprot:scaffold299845_cov16-Prasinocladus_malaysianus.AAC.1